MVECIQTKGKQMWTTDDDKTDADELPEEIQFDYSKAKPNRFAEQLQDRQILIALDPDVAAVFRDAEAVNRVLRALIETMPSTSSKAA